MDEKDKNFSVDVKELILAHNGKSAGTETFVYEPSNIEEEAFGNLYIIGWLQNKRHELEFLPNLVASVVRREFYASDKRTAEEHFESALKKANATLLDINKTNKDIVRDIHFCIVNIVGETIRLCAFGDMIALLYRNGEIADMRRRIKKNEKAELFSDVITGTVAQGDSIMLGTRPVIDLFSDKGLLKLFSLPLVEQSEIITKIYQKNAQEALLPDQALVLIAVQGVLDPRWIPFKKNGGEKKRIDASPAAHERALGIFTATAQRTGKAGTALYRYAREIPTMSVRKRNARILFSIFSGIILFGSAYAMMNAQFMSLRVLEQRIETARAASDSVTATELLESVQRDAIARIPSLLMSSAAQTLFHAANTDLNALHGIHIAPPSFLARVPTASVIFAPSFIFDDPTYIYIFSKTPDTVAKISKNDGSQRFVFLNGMPSGFHTERMMQKDDIFYFINDTEKRAVAWQPRDNALTEAKRPAGKSLVNERDAFGAHFALSGPAIVRTTSDGNEPEKYLIGQIPSLTDFTVSHDNTALYLLSGTTVLGLSL